VSENAASGSATTAATEAATATTQAATATTQAATATTQAGIATTQATTATTQAGIATTKASEAAASAASTATAETNSAASATSSATSAVDSANSAAAAASALDTFDDRYLGSKSAEPTVDNDGDALVQGALYFDTTAQGMKVYDGANWISASAAGVASLNIFEYTATASQTTFTGLDDNTAAMSFIGGNIIVSLNGIILDPSDYSEVNGITIELVVGAALNDLLNIYAFKSFTIADHYSKIQTDAGFVDQTSNTGSANMPNGTTAERDVSPTAGALRFNSTESSFEGYSGTEWGSIGGGAADGVFYENEQNIVADYTIVSTKNAMTAGPININAGVTVTIETGARWVVL
jgi:hypothetical protein